MKRRRPFDKQTFIEGFYILQEVTPTDSSHPAHWWDTNDGQIIRSRQNQFINDIKGYQNFLPITKEGFNKWLENISAATHWPKVSDPVFWGSNFGEMIVKEFWAMVNTFIAYLNTLE